MDFRLLHYFVTVAEELNITRAAAVLKMSQPPLSSRIKQLEQDLGTVLFIRRKRGLQLTSTGKIFYKRAKQILELADHTREEIMNYENELSGHLMLGTVEGRAPYLLARWIAGFREEFPLVTYTLRSGGSDDIHLFCAPDLFEALLGSVRDLSAVNKSLSRIYDLTAHTGIFDYDISISNAANVINIHINALYPGRAVTRAERTGDRTGLSARELDVWSAASQIAGVLRMEDPLMTAKLVHDWICDHVVYVDDETTDEDDTAIGAILNGRANCDGYADAFYLIGSLAE